MPASAGMTIQGLQGLPRHQNAHETMPFAYYKRLTRVQQRIYRQSDEVHAIRLPAGTPLHPLIEKLAAALQREHR